MHGLWIDADVRRFLWDDVVIPRDRAAEVLAASAADFERHQYGLWAVHDLTTGALAGFCGIRSSDVRPPELLYGFLRTWWGRGYATETARAVLDYAFDSLGMPVVEAATDAPNVASLRVLERLGMTIVRRAMLNGLDTIFCSLTRERFYNQHR
jgi:ribosomal-protein-alanine N-acetyltransferase